MVEMYMRKVLYEKNMRKVLYEKHEKGTFWKTWESYFMKNMRKVLYEKTWERYFYQKLLSKTLNEDLGGKCAWQGPIVDIIIRL